MSLKAGDRLLCKKSVLSGTFTNNKYYNKYYIVTDVFDDIVYFNNDFYFRSDSPNNCNNWYIWDYFYTPQEVRKLKLERLNDVKSR